MTLYAWKEGGGGGLKMYITSNENEEKDKVWDQ